MECEVVIIKALKSR